MNLLHRSCVLLLVLAGCTYETDGSGFVGTTTAGLNPGESPIETISGDSRLPDGRVLKRTRRIYASGETVDTWTNPAGIEVDRAGFESERASARESVRASRGSMRATLKAARDSSGEGALYNVVGWLAVRTPPPNRDDPAPGVAAAQAEIASLRAEVRAIVDATGGNTMTTIGTSPLVHFSVDGGTLDDLAWSGLLDVLQIQSGSGTHTGDVWHAAAGLDVTDAAGWDGSSRRVAILENYQPDDYTNLSNVLAIANTNGGTSSTTRWVTGIVRSTLSPYGSASDTGILIANWNGFTGGRDAVTQWAMDQNATVVSFSYSFSNGSDGGVSAYDRYRDWLTLRPPYAMFVSSAGNTGDHFDLAYRYVHNRHYNGIVVGGANDQGTGDRYMDTIYSSSSYRNHTTPNGDRELPEIVAPAVSVTAAGYTGTGTSAAAPIVAGVVASVVERNSGLASWPEVQKAIVLASAAECNVDGVVLRLTDFNDDKDGVGQVAAPLATNLAVSTNSRSSGNAAANQGFAYGHMSFTSNFTGTLWNNSYNLLTGDSGWVAITFTWDTTGSCPSSTTCEDVEPDADLNLYIIRPGSPDVVVATSASYDNNYEHVMVQLSANTAYRIEVRKNTTRTSGTYWGLAWTTHLGSACPNSF